MNVKSELTRRTRATLLLAGVATALCAAVFTGGIATADPAPPKAPEGGMGVLFNCADYPSDQQTTRSQALLRAQSWINERVPYSQSACHSNQYGNYRTDCSGFVSMAWGLRRSFTTSDINLVSHTIARSDLQPGDALNDPGSHVALFVGWADSAKTRPVVREQAGPDGSPTTERVWSEATASAYTPIRYNNIVNDAHISRFAFLNSSGHVFAKDDVYGSWLDFTGGGATKMVVSGDWTGIISGGDFYAKQGLYGSWLQMTSGGGVTDIAISGNRFAFTTNTGTAMAKDGAYSSWLTLGSATKVVLDGDWIGLISGDNFLAKQGLYSSWLTMTSGGGVTDIAIAGNRFAFTTNTATMMAKDGAYSSWLTLGSATKVVLNGDWIGAISGGAFVAKQGLYGTWLTMTGTGTTDISISGDWFGATINGDYLAKQGAYNSWLTMASGGQVTANAITTVG